MTLHRYAGIVARVAMVWSATLLGRATARRPGWMWVGSAWALAHWSPDRPFLVIALAPGGSRVPVPGQRARPVPLRPRALARIRGGAAAMACARQLLYLAPRL